MPGSKRVYGQILIGGELFYPSVQKSTWGHDPMTHLLGLPRLQGTWATRFATGWKIFNALANLLIS